MDWEAEFPFTMDDATLSAELQKMVVNNIMEKLKRPGWRATLKPGWRQIMVNNVTETLESYLLLSDQEDLQELKKIAERLEEKVYATATSQSDYEGKISLKMLTMESKSQDSLPPNSAGTGNNWRPAASWDDWRPTLQPESRQRIVNRIMEELKRHLPFSGEDGLRVLKRISVRFEEMVYDVATSQSDYLRQISLKFVNMERKPLNSLCDSLPPNQGPSLATPLPAIQVQVSGQLLSQEMQKSWTSTGVQSSVCGVNQTPIDVIGLNTSMQNHMSNVAENPAGSTWISPSASSDMFWNPEPLIPGRQHVFSQQQQQQQQQQQHILLRQPQIQRQLQPQQLEQQQLQFQYPQLQSLQQSCMQTSSVMQHSSMQLAPMSSHLQNQVSSVQQSAQSILQHHPQSVITQQQLEQLGVGIHQQQTQMMQQQFLSTPPQPQLWSTQQQQQHPQQQQQQQQPMQSQPQWQQQWKDQPNNLLGLRQQHLGPQSNFLGLQQQQKQQQRKRKQQQQQQRMQEQHERRMRRQQQRLRQKQRLWQQKHSQQLFGLSTITQNYIQHGLNMLQHQRMPASEQAPSSLVQPQRSFLGTPSNSTGQAGGGDWEEQVEEKIHTMKDSYLPELLEPDQKISIKLEQPDSLPQKQILEGQNIDVKLEQPDSLPLKKPKLET